MRLETQLAQMDFVLLNSDQCGLVLLLELRSEPGITIQFPSIINGKRLMGWVILWGFLSYTSVSKGNNSPPLSASTVNGA